MQPLSIRPACLASALLGALMLTALPTIAGAKGAQSVKIRRLAMNPRRLGSGGGNVFIKVAVSGPVVNSVSARAEVVGGSGGAIVQLSRGSGRGVFEGTVRVPPNYRTQPATASIKAIAYTSEIIVERLVGSVSLSSGNDSLPPPPPPSN